jgi:hypothetical protein
VDDPIVWPWPINPATVPPLRPVAHPGWTTENPAPSDGHAEGGLHTERSSLKRIVRLRDIS